MATPTDPLARRIARAITGRRPEDEIYFNRVSFVKRVSVLSVTPGPPLAEQQGEQLALLDRCINDPPGGRILAREVLTGTFRTLNQNAESEGEDPPEVELMHTRREIFHVGFERKPFWLDVENG